jgi:hypothetical protein
MADKKYEVASSPEPVEPKVLNLTDPKYFPPMPTEPAEDHAKHLAELEALGYDVSDQKGPDQSALRAETKKKSDK